MNERSHINADGEFQSDKYPTCPAGKVPLSTKDPIAQDLLWVYAQRRRVVDADFSFDLEQALRANGFTPGSDDWIVGRLVQAEQDRDVLYSEHLDALNSLREVMALALEFGWTGAQDIIGDRHPAIADGVAGELTEAIREEHMIMVRERDEARAALGAHVASEVSETAFYAVEANLHEARAEVQRLRDTLKFAVMPFLHSVARNGDDVLRAGAGNVIEQVRERHPG